MPREDVGLNPWKEHVGGILINGRRGGAVPGSPLLHRGKSGGI